jgi:phosphatidylglycerol---prolipoprotein diacylglyceryl transferase
VYPILWESETIIIPAWHVFLALGVVAAFYFAAFLNQSFLKADSLSYKEISGIYLAVYIAGYFGARLFSVYAEQGLLPHQGEFWLQLFSLGPMTFYGGAIGGVSVGYIYCRLKHISPWVTMDLGIPALMMGLCLGRVGCFLNGDDFGRPVMIHDNVAPWWSVTFPVLNDGVARYPVQIYESLFGLTLALLAVYVLKYTNLKRGILGVTTLSLYAAGRWILETYRGDDRGYLFDSIFSPSQTVSLMMLGVCALLFVKLRVGDA